jgi:sulfite oxidase
MKEAREKNKVWVTYKDGVYDLSVFAKNHPGGAEKLLMAKGGPIEPFWEQYPFHKEAQVLDLLSKYRIGDLHEDDILDPNDLPDFKDLQT